MCLPAVTTIVRLFSDIDQGVSAEVINNGQVIAGGQKGVKARDLATMDIISQVFCYLFGTTVRVQGKTYLIGIRSALQFLQRNDIATYNANHEIIIDSLKNYYREQKISGAKICFYENASTLTISASLLKFVLKNLGIVPIDSIIEQLSPVNGHINTQKSKFFEVIKPYKDQLSAKEPFINLCDWLKEKTSLDSIENQPMITVDISSPLPLSSTDATTASASIDSVSSSPTCTPTESTSTARTISSDTLPRSTDIVTTTEEENTLIPHPLPNEDDSSSILEADSSTTTLPSSTDIVTTTEEENTLIHHPLPNEDDSSSILEADSSTTTPPRSSAILTIRKENHTRIPSPPIFEDDSSSISEADSPERLEPPIIPIDIMHEAAKRAAPSQKYGTASRSTLSIENPWSSRAGAKRNILSDHDLQKLAESLHIPRAIETFRALRKDTEATFWRQLSILELAADTNYGKEGSGQAKSDYLEAIADCFVQLPKSRQQYIFAYIHSHKGTSIYEIGTLYGELSGILGGLIDCVEKISFRP